MPWVMHSVPSISKQYVCVRSGEGSGLRSPAEATSGSLATVSAREYTAPLPACWRRRAGLGSAIAVDIMDQLLMTAAERVVFVNGALVPESEAKVSIYDSALMFGDV